MPGLNLSSKDHGLPLKSTVKSDRGRSDYSGLGKSEGPLVAISWNSFKAASPCPASPPLVSPSSPSPSSISPSPASPFSPPTQDCLYPHHFQQRHIQPTSCPSEVLSNVSNPPPKDEFASVLQHLHFYFKLGFQTLPENSWRLMSLPEKWSAASYLDWKGQISRNKEQWKVLISRLFWCDIKAWWKNRGLGVANAFQLRACTYK